jgi:nanoRNase/pAp phosphatase (c-di-AMP/oligoRNAs hydrolase)
MTAPVSPKPLALGRTAEVRDLLRGKHRLLVLTHANPDPDSLGSAVGLGAFARALGVESTFAVVGRILRAENQAMVRELAIETQPLEGLDLGQFDCAALVDTQPGFGHTPIPSGLRIDLVIDHHVSDAVRPRFDGVRIIDLRHGVGATSSIVASYFLESGIVPGRDVATALMYGIRTDTADLSRNLSETDTRAYDFLSPLVDRRKLLAITRPRLPPEYFQTLRDALGKIRLYEHIALCSLGRTPSPEMVAEVADLLMRMEGLQAVFCGGLVDSTFYVSVRTDPSIADAWHLIHSAMKGEDGSCGGHGAVAGGSIQLPSGDDRALKRLERRLERRILKAMGVKATNATAIGQSEE